MISKPNIDQIITIDNIRISLITSKIVRLEYSLENNFIDYTSTLIQNRNIEKVEFEKNIEKDMLIIKTKDIKIYYKMRKPLRKSTLKIINNFNQYDSGSA